MFKSMLGRVLEGLTNISPVKNLIKYILDRSLNELLSDQISLEDFKNGQLHLSNISLNLDKINREYLLSSPYILHEGRVRRLRITLPGWSQISTKSIEVTAEGLQLDLKPNKQFYDNFKEAMREKQADIMQKEDPGEINQDNPMDFFRQLVKQIILNIRFRVDNSVVRLFMNEPTKQLASNKPQYYLMFRVPLLKLGKSEQVVAQKEDEEQIKFDLITPQMSLHLLRENSQFPEYLNQNASKDDFPFTYPPVSHPSTILVVGKLSNIEKVDCDLCTKLTITLTTLFKKQKKYFSIGGRISHFQSIIDPIQLKIFTRFFAQIMQFQKILKSVMAQMGLNSLAATLTRKESKGKSGNYDLFSSIMMSISEPSKNAAEGNILNDLMHSKEMTQAAEEFNQSAVAQLRSSGELAKSGEWKNINFKQETIVNFELGIFQCHFLKYVSITPYERRWSAEHRYEQVNQSLGCSHYRLTLKGLSYSFGSANNQHDLKMKFVKLQDVRLTNIQAFHHSVSEEFYDLDSISFENTEIKQDYFTKRPELSVFRTTKEQHYCMEELFRLSEGQQPQVIKSNLKTYAFIPVGAQCGEGAGLKLSFNGHIKELKVDIKDVAIMLNFQIWKDVLNIIFPVHLYRKLNEKINLQSSEMAQTQSQASKSNDLLFQSQYRFSGNLMQQVHEKQQKIEIKVKVGLVYCFYRQTAVLKSKQNLFEEVERKILDSDNFSRMCFCGLNERGLYAEIHDLEWQQISEEFNLSIKEIKAGLLSVENSKVEADVIPILIADGLRVEESKVEHKRESKSMDYSLRSRTYLSKACFKVELPALISFIDMAKKMVAVIESLQSFKKNLSAKLLIIEQEILNRPRVLKEKPRKERIVEVFVAEIQLKMLLLSTYARSIFFSKQKEDQQITIDALAIGMTKKMDVRLGQFRNQMVTAQYPLEQTYKGIKDTHLILDIGRGSEKKIKGIPLENQNKPKKRIERRLNFFEKLQKQKSSLWIIVKNKMDIGSERKQSKTFRFDKARKNSVIEEQKKLKEINVLPLEVYLHAGNIAFLLLHKREIESTMEEVSKVFKEIQEQSKEIIEQQRRDSIESEGEVTTEINLKLKDLQLNIDVKPDFKYDPESGLRILSNCRLFANIRIQQLQLTTNPDTSITTINNGLLSLNAYFLHFLDKDIETNPLLLNYQKLEVLGFIKFLEMNELSLKLSHNSRLNILEIIQCGIDMIRVDLCLSTIPLIQIFIDHFVKHSLSGNYGGVEEEQFVILDHEDSDEQLPEDLTLKLDEYNELIELKKQAFNDFSVREFSIRQSETTVVALKHFKIGSIKMKLFGGSDFHFIEANSLYESKASLRSRKQAVDRMNFFSVDITNIRSKFEKNAAVSQMVLELEKMEVILSFKRKEGILWGAEKDFLVTLLKINMPLKIMAEISQKNMMLKLSSLEITANLTDQLLPLVNNFSKAMNDAARSPWKRYYKPGKEQQSKMMVLLILPEGRITASAEIKRAKLLNQRILKLPTLIVHEEGSNGGRINRIIHDWAMQIFTNNLGTLLTGALFQLVSACIGLLLGGIKQFLALFFPSLNA